MTHRPWRWLEPLVERLGDSSLMDEGLSIQREPRSEGLHASSLLEKLHPPETNDFTDEQLNLYRVMGLAFEDRVETALLSLAREADWPFDAIRAGEVCADGVTCSPDILLLSKEDGSMRELSIKCTWKSSRGAPTEPKFAYYLDQCLTYATPLQTLESVLLVYFVNGTYKPPVPRILAWELGFTAQERGETWEALQNMRVHRDGR